jgi:hypothetical protein
MKKDVEMDKDIEIDTDMDIEVCTNALLTVFQRAVDTCDFIYFGSLWHEKL